jgi:hypothetical protein
VGVKLFHILAYMSSSSTLLTPADLEAILKVSERNNTTDDITGVLMHHNGLFFQILEGKKKLVEDCYNRICLDTRHRAISLMVSEPVRNKAFLGWSMRYVGPDEIGRYNKGTFADIEYLMKKPMPKSSMALNLLRSIQEAFPYTH